MAEQPKVSILLQLVDKFTEPINGLRGTLNNFGDQLTTLGKTLVATFATTLVADFFKQSVAEGLKAEEGFRRLATSVKDAGGDFDTLRPSIETTIKSVEKMSTASGVDLRDALTNLIARTGDVSGSMKNLGLVTEIAAFKHIDLSDASTFLAKVMNGNLTPLMREYGIKAKDSADAIAVLTQMTKGYAEDAAAGMSGAIRTLVRDWDELKVEVGLAVIGSDNATEATRSLSAVLVELQGWIHANSGEIAGFVDGVVKAGEAIVKFGAFIVEHTPNMYTLGQAVKWLTGTHDEATTAVTEGQRKMAASFMDTLRQGTEAQEGLTKAFFDNAGKQVEGMQQFGETRRRLTTEENAAIQAITDDGYKSLSGAQKSELSALYAEYEAHGAARLNLTKDQARELLAFHKASNAEVETETKASHALLLEIIKAANKIEADEVGGHYKEYEALIGSFWEKIKKTTGVAQADLIDALARAQGDLLLKWAGMGESLDRLVPKVKDTTESMNLQIKPMDDLGVAIESYDVKVTGLTSDEAKAEAEHIRHRQAVMDDATALSTAAQQVGNLAGAFRGISPELDTVLDKFQGLATGVSGIADAVAGLASGTFSGILGGLTSGISGIVSLINTFTGESASARAVRLALEATVVELEVHRRTLGDLISVSDPGRNIVAFADVLTTYLGRIGNTSNLPAAFTVGDSALAPFLAAKGLTVAQLKAFAKSVGVDLSPNGSGLNLQQLRNLLQMIGTLDTGVGQDFGSQLSNLQQVWNVGQVGPAGQLQDILGLLTGPQGSPFLASAFQGKSPQEILAALPGILQNRGAVGAAGLGGLNLQQFGDVINMLASIIRQLPAGAALPGLPGSTLPPPGLPPIDTGLPPINIPPPPVDPNSFLPLNPGVGPGTGVTIDSSINGGITVNVGPGNDPAAVGQAVTDGVAAAMAARTAEINAALARIYLGDQQASGDITLAAA